MSAKYSTHRIKTLLRAPLSIIALLGIMFIVQAALGTPSASAAGNLTPGKSEALINGVFPQNNLTGWNPLECSVKGATSDSCFKIDSSVGTQDFWYAEGCLNTGDCTGGKYFASGKPAGSDNGLVVTKNNPWVYKDTKTDDEWGGMQYIYAENYDVESYEGAYTKMTPNGGSSTQKYYWIVLPDSAYSNGFGETYVATFENFDDPVYFIVFDTHACEHQGEDYCGKATANPDEVAIGKEFFGTFTKNAGSPTAAADIAGKLTSLCRISGSGEVKVAQSASNAVATSGGSSSSSDLSSDTSGQTIADKAKELAWTEDQKSNSTSPTSAFQSAANSAGLTVDDDCLKFVQVVVKSSGVDPDFPTGTYSHNGGVDEWYTVDYMNDSGKWTKIDTTDESALEPGDILVSAVNGTGNNHIFIYLGDGKVAAANQGQWYGRIENLSDEWSQFGDSAPFHYGSNQYQVFRASSGCTSYEGDYPEYFQNDYSESYNTGTIGSDGCGPSSMAMLTTYVTGQDVFPNDVAAITNDGTGAGQNYVQSRGPTMAALDKRVCEKYGCEVTEVSYTSWDDAETKMKQYLNDGYVLHFSGAGSTPFTGGGHYIGIFGIDGDTVHVADSAFGNKDYNLRDLIHSGLYKNTSFSAIKGNGARNSCDNNNCAADTNGGPVGGGLDDEQAQRLVDNYNANVGNWDSKVAVSSNYCIDNPPGTCASKYSNCTLFSAFFMEMFTDVGFGQGWPNGSDVVGKLGGMGFETGSEPQVYSVFSYNNHTGVVIRIDGDTIVTAEAGYPSWPGYVRHRSVQEYQSLGTTYAYINDRLNQQELSNYIGSN